MGIWMDEVNDMTNEVEALRARAESAEADLAAARSDLSALAAVVGSAVVAGALAPGESLSQPSGHIIVSTVSGLCARAEAAERRAEALEAALKQAQDDGRLMLASMGSDMWRRLDGAGRTRLEQELDRSLRDSTEDDGERVPYAELYAYRRLLALGDFFDNPRRESPPVAALPEPEWYTGREADDENEDEDCDEDEDGADDGNDDASRAVARWEVSDGDR